MRWMFDLACRTEGKLSGLPYQGRRSAVTVGPAGEWIEFDRDELTACRLIRDGYVSPTIRMRHIMRR